MFTIRQRNLYTENKQEVSAVIDVNDASQSRFNDIPTTITKCNVTMTQHEGTIGDYLAVDIAFPVKHEKVMGYDVRTPLNCIGYLYAKEVRRWFTTLKNIEKNNGKATIYVAKVQLDANHFNVYGSFSETELATSIAGLNIDRALEKALAYEAKQEAKKAAKAAYVAPEEEAESIPVTCSNSHKYKKCEKCNMAQSMSCKHFKA